MFKDVSFRYPGAPVAAIHNVSFTIEPGERVGIIGRVGSGKSTLHKLLLGLYEPDEGSILFDGTESRQIDPVDLRRNIGCVPQEVELFRGSVRDNITIGTPQASDAAVLRAAELATADDFVSRHPMGYDLPVGERGESLSGGQRQAIAAARAILHEPAIVLLDEPTSSMDSGAEARLKKNFGAALSGKTLILITHRASLLSLVDRLIVLEAGAVLADGPKEAVLKAIAEGKVAILGAAAMAETMGWNRSQIRATGFARRLAAEGMTVADPGEVWREELHKIGAAMLIDWLKGAPVSAAVVLDAYNELSAAP